MINKQQHCQGQEKSENKIHCNEMNVMNVADVTLMNFEVQEKVMSFISVNM